MGYEIDGKSKLEMGGGGGGNNVQGNELLPSHSFKKYIPKQK